MQIRLISVEAVERETTGGLTKRQRRRGIGRERKSP